MKSFTAVAALLSAVPFVLGQGLQVNSLAGAVECEPILVSWSGGTPPYYVAFIPAGQPSGAPMKQFPPQQGTSFTWTVDLPAGTTFSTELKDASGQPVYSGIQNVEPGTSSSCLNTSVFESGTASGTGSASTSSSQSLGAVAVATSSVGTSSTASGTSATTTGATSTAHTTTTTGSSSASSATATVGNQNAGVAVHGSSANAFGIAGLLGLIGAAIF